MAYFSDAAGEYQLFLHDQSGFRPPAVIDLGPDPSFFYNPVWSPDSIRPSPNTSEPPPDLSAAKEFKVFSKKY